MPPTVIRRRRSDDGSIHEERIDRYEGPQHPYERPDLREAVLNEPIYHNRRYLNSGAHEAYKARQALDDLFPKRPKFNGYMTEQQARRELEKLFSKKNDNI